MPSQASSQQSHQLAPSVNSILHTFVWVILLIAGCILWLIAYTANNYNYHFQRKHLEATEQLARQEESHLHHPLGHKEHTAPKIILYWNNFGTILPYEFGLGHDPFVKHRCTIHNCMTTDDRSLLPKADAVIFHVRGLEEDSKEELPKHAHPDQLFIFFTLESPIHTYHNLTAFHDYFNLTFSYRTDSDIFSPMGKVVFRPSSKPLRHLNMAKINSHKTKMVAWVISRCEKEGSLRWEYGQELAKHIQIDIFGKCGTLKCPKTNFGVKCYTDISKKYKFYLGFENSYCRDYATEKVWRTLQYDIVPVVLGGLNYSKYLPPKSHINVQDFASPKELANFLQNLAANDEEYFQYYDWKEKLRLRTVTNLRRDGFCQLCEILHNRQAHKHLFKTGFDLHEWWETQGQCVGGDSLATTLGLHHLVTNGENVETTPVVHHKSG